MASDTIGEFLKHAEPTAFWDEIKDKAEEHMKWRIQKRIASGEATHRVDYEEAFYEGNRTAPDLAEWLSKYDSSWEVDTGDYGENICVIRETRIPYTEEEIAAAKKFIEEHPEPDTERIRFRVNHD